MNVYFAPKFGNLFMGVMKDDGSYGLFGCKVKKGADARDALLKALVGQRYKTLDRKPFIDTDAVKVFSGEAGWVSGANIALTEEMVNGFILNVHG